MSLSLARHPLTQNKKRQYALAFHKFGKLVISKKWFLDILDRRIRQGHIVILLTKNTIFHKLMKTLLRWFGLIMGLAIQLLL